MDIREIGCRNVEGIRPARIRIKSLAFVNEMMNLCIPLKQ